MGLGTATVQALLKRTVWRLKGDKKNPRGDGCYTDMERLSPARKASLSVHMSLFCI